MYCVLIYSCELIEYIIEEGESILLCYACYKFMTSICNELIRCVGQMSSKEGEFRAAHGLALHTIKYMYAITITIVFRCLTWT